MVFLGTSVVVVAFVLVVVGFATSTHVGWIGGTDFFGFSFVWVFYTDSCLSSLASMFSALVCHDSPDFLSRTASIA